MLASCDKCQRHLEYQGDRPSFCAYCGERLGSVALHHTDSYQHPPAGDAASITQMPPANRIISFSGGFASAIPDRIGGLRVLRQLGAGGMGTVFEAEDAANGRKVAVKLIKPQIAASQDNLDRFRQEGRLASLIAHPRCVFVYHADEDQGRPYIVMELMPGATLKDIVSQQGPLQVGQAISKMLDVIDGLQAAHQLGVIHRDVKPSNCFVLTDGHVKVGDFGLSKVLPTQLPSSARTPLENQPTTAENPEAITRTGVFVGTPLYASPEQIKGELVDFRTDVYSVSATLYFLLTGQAPFEGGDNTATIARIVSESPSSIQSLRPDIPIELDRVVLRGLERDRDLRYSSLADLRSALLPFLPGYLHNAPRRVRIRAGIVDAALLAPGLLLINQLVPRLLGESEFAPEIIDIICDLTMWLLILAYFVATEVMAGASFGKWLLHLRVGGLRPGKPPKRRQLLLRAMGFFVIVALPGLLALALTGSDWIKWIFHGIGILLLFDSMRAQGGFRGLHEILSKTCVVQVPTAPMQIQFPYIPPVPPAPLPPGIPKKIGSYAITGIHRVLDDRIFLVGTDLILDRQVWIVMRPLEEGKIAPARREISRRTRLRWLGGGDVALSKGTSRFSHHWDAFIAPGSGTSLTRLVAVHGKLSWNTSRQLLLQLADELSMALSDDTFPDELSLEQVWVMPDGQLVIVGARFLPQQSVEDCMPDAERSVLFLKQAALLMLEGRVGPSTMKRPVRAPLPVFDRPMIDRLTDARKPPFAHPQETAAELRKSLHRPAEVTTMMRLGQILLFGILLFPIVLAILVLGRYYSEIKPTLQLTHQVRRADRIIEWFGDKANIPAFKQFLRDYPQETAQIGQAAFVEFAADPKIKLLTPVMRDRLLMAACQGWIKKQKAADVAQLTIMRNQLSFAAIVPQFLAVEMISSASQNKQPGNGMMNVQEEIRASLLHAIKPGPLEKEVLPLVQKLNAFQLAVLTIGSWFAVWIVWSMVTHGGISFRLMGIDLQQKHGKRAGLLRCGWRTFLVWFPFFALILGSVWIQDISRNLGPAYSTVWIYWIPWYLALIYLAACAISALIWPGRGFHDRLAGVYLVPR